MSKLPSIKTVKLLKTLLKLGFYKHHQTGSHIQLKHSDGRRTTLPYHKGKDIKLGTLRAILKDINIDDKDFLKVLKK